MIYSLPSLHLEFVRSLVDISVTISVSRVNGIVQIDVKSF
jgi:hypothetical protein